jgi:eukaryotic-like serine/threonine-protein kinase
LCRNAGRSSKELNLIDVGTTFCALATFSLAFIVIPQQGFEPALIMTLITLSGLITRAVVVPGTARRTLWISIMCCVPALAASYVIANQAPQTLAAMPWTPVASCIYVGTWLAITVALSTLASRIIYGLSERVRAATELGQYTLEEKIGEGGMGMVYRARHALLRRPTAIKLLPPELAGERSIQRFEREVQLTSALTHPNTIAIYDYGRSPDGVFYYAMEYLEGITLEDLVIHDGPQPPARVIHLIKQLCGALAEAHGVHLIHRDVKPANIVLCVRGGVADYVKVLDFGLVKEIAAPSPKLSAAQTVVGTPAYLAPEALTRPDEVDERVDLYAVGAVAYELLTGKPVFEGATMLEVCGKILHEMPVPPSQRTGGAIPTGLEALVLGCLSKDPNARPRSAVEISDALTEHGDGWTALDATRWWDQRAPAVIAAVKARAKRSDPVSERRTVEVDLAKRQWAAAE